MARRVGALCFALCVAGMLLPASGVAAAAGSAAKEPPRPQPQRLWDAYPLNAERTGTTAQPSRSIRTPPAQAAGRPSSDSDNSASLLLWIAVAALGAALVAAVVSWRVPALAGLPRRGVRGTAERLRTLRSERAARARRQRTTAEEGLALAANGQRIALREGPRFHVPGARFARLVGDALRERAAARARAREAEAEHARTPEPPPPDPLDEALHERAVLKSKRAVEVEKLKEKNEQHEVGLLKAKVGRRRSTSAPMRLSTQRGSKIAPGATCRIGWSRGYVKSEFYAEVRTPDGQETLALHSPPFRWSKPTPPQQDDPEVARAHQALVAELEANGWIETGQGEDWYTIEFEPRPTLASRPGQKGEG